MRLVPALAQMEATGVAFDPSVLCRQIRQANRRLREIEREADALVSKQVPQRRARVQFGVVGGCREGAL